MRRRRRRRRRRREQEKEEKEEEGTGQQDAAGLGLARISGLPNPRRHEKGHARGCSGRDRDGH
jgi:hypothetical protein